MKYRPQYIQIYYIWNEIVLFSFKFILLLHKKSLSNLKIWTIMEIF